MSTKAATEAIEKKAVVDAAAAAAAKEKKADSQAIRRLLQLARPEAKNISAAIVLLVISSGITMSVPFSMGKIIDLVTRPDVNEFAGLTMPQFFAVISGIFVIGGVANMGRVMLFRISGERIIQRLRNNLYGSILRQDMSFFDKNRSGELISRLAVDTAVVGKSITNNISDGLRAVATATVGSTMMFYVSPHLTGIMLLVVPPVAGFAILYGRYVKTLSRQTQTALSEITKVAEERIGNIRTVQAFAKEPTEANRYSLRVQDVYSLAKKEALASGVFFGGAGLSGNMAILAVLWYGGHLVMENAITVGDLASFMLYTAYVGSSLGGLTSFYSEIMKGIGASSRLFELLDRKPMIAIESGLANFDVQKSIRFENIDFTYPARPHSPIFSNMSLTVNPGTVIAVVGPSGSGKSTIGSLLLRYYDPNGGTIHIGDHNIKDINTRWWREQVGLVSQEPVLFAGTIADNIAYGVENATLEQVKEAAVKANCASFIERFHDGYQTFVGERGISLSGGQKQRIAIARALLKNPAVLILDEATSALDAESEALVQDALNHLMKGRTVFTIAHRISTIRSADLVACLDGGRIAELGTYDDLLSRENGVFKRLMEHQTMVQPKPITTEWAEDEQEKSWKKEEAY